MNRDRFESFSIIFAVLLFSLFSIQISGQVFKIFSHIPGEMRKVLSLSEPGSTIRNILTKAAQSIHLTFNDR